MTVNLFWGKFTRWLCRYHGSKKFHQNYSISHRFWQNCVFAFNTEIKDGHQKWQENNFWEISPVDCAFNLGLKNFAKITLSRNGSEINVFYTEIQDGCQKWPKKTFLGKIARRLCRYPGGQNFCLHRSILYRFHD